MSDGLSGIRTKFLGRIGRDSHEQGAVVETSRTRTGIYRVRPSDFRQRRMSTEVECPLVVQRVDSARLPVTIGCRAGIRDRGEEGEAIADHRGKVPGTFGQGVGEQLDVAAAPVNWFSFSKQFEFS